MNNYELMYVLTLANGEDQLDDYNERVQQLVAQNAEIQDVDVWGKRRLAYEIEDQKEGYYVVVKFNAEATAPKEIDRVLKISDFVLRHMICKIAE